MTAVLEKKVKKIQPVHVRCNVLARSNFIHIKSLKILIGRYHIVGLSSVVVVII